MEKKSIEGFSENWLSKIGNMERAIHLLEEQGFWSECVMFKWVLLRTKIFNYLEKNDITFNTTQEAITKFFFILPNESERAMLHSLYSLSILIEWDISFSITEKEEIVYLNSLFSNVTKFVKNE